MKISEAKVAWVTSTLGVNGRLVYLEPVLKAFAGRCRGFCVFTASDTSSSEVRIVRAGKYKPMYRVVWRLESRDTKEFVFGIGGNLTTPGVINKLREYDPDLVILNEFGLQSVYGLVFARLLQRRARVLLIMEAKPRFYGEVFLRPRLLIRRILAKSADALLTNNEEGQQHLNEMLGIPKSSMVAKPYLVSDIAGTKEGIEPAPRSSPAENEPVRFLYVGQLIPRKGIQDALQACAKLLPKYRGRFVFELVGDGPCRPELERKARVFGLGNHVIFHGPQSYESLGQFYSQAHVFLFPTLADYRALVTFEAMSMGLPILASIHDGGSRETVTQGENGYTFDPRDPEGLADLMSLYIENPSLIPVSSAKSLEKARLYTVSRAVEGLMEACDLALGGKLKT